MSTQARPVPWAGPSAAPWSVLALLPPAFRNWIKNYYAYATSYLTLGASATSTNNIALQSDSFFVLLMATCVCSSSNDLTLLTYRPATVQIFDSSAGINLFSQAIGVDEYFGDGQQPGISAFPYIFKPGGAIQVTLTNLEATARNYRLTFHGFKCVQNSNQDTGDEFRGMSGPRNPAGY